MDPLPIDIDANTHRVRDFFPSAFLIVKDLSPEDCHPRLHASTEGPVEDGHQGTCHPGLHVGFVVVEEVLPAS